MIVFDLIVVGIAIIFVASVKERGGIIVVRKGRKIRIVFNGLF